MKFFGKNKEEEDFEEEEDGRSVKRKSTKPLEKKGSRTGGKDKEKKVKKKWGRRERFFVLSILASTTIGSGILALSARSWKLPGYPRIDFAGISLEQTYVLEAERQEGHLYDQVEDDFVSMTEELTGVYGFYVSRIAEGVAYGHLADESFQAASLIKLPVMVMVLNEVDEGNLLLSDAYRLDSEDISSGAGNMYLDDLGTVYSYQEMIMKMGQVSDNTAYNAFVRILGEADVQEFIYDLGMRDTSLEKNTTSPSDVGRLFRKIMRGNILSTETRQLLLDSLTNTSYEEHLVEGVPDDVTVSHKYGLEANVVNDAGVVFVDDPYVVVLMSKGVKIDEANSVFPELSRLIFDFEQMN